MSNYGGGYGQGGYGGGGNNYGGAPNPYAQQAGQYEQRGNQYGQQAPNPYSQQQQSSPYSQQQQPAQQQSNPYGQQGGGYGAGNDMEMGQMNGGYNAPAREDPHAILNEVQDLDRGIDTLPQRRKEIEKAQKAVIYDVQGGPASESVRHLDRLNTESMNLYRNFTKRIQKIKSTPGAGDPQNANQVGRIERKLKEQIQLFQTTESQYRKMLNQRAVEQYATSQGRAVDELTPEERQDIAENPNSQIFAQALLSQDRRGNARTAQAAVQQRHEDIQKIERQVVELAQLFEDMNVLVVQQEPTVARIDEQATNVHQDVTNANEQLDGAVKKARAARKKKWICLGIVVLILIIIAIIVAIVVTQLNK